MTSCFGLRSRHSEHERLLTGALPTDWGSTLYDGSDRRPAIRRRSFDGRSAQRLAAQVVQGWMAAVGRDATSDLLSSAPETGLSSFASRKLPDAIECSRPLAVVELSAKLSFSVAAEPRAVACLRESTRGVS